MMSRVAPSDVKAAGNNTSMCGLRFLFKDAAINWAVISELSATKTLIVVPSAMGVPLEVLPFVRGKYLNWGWLHNLCEAGIILWRHFPSWGTADNHRKLEIGVSEIYRAPINTYFRWHRDPAKVDVRSLVGEGPPHRLSGCSQATLCLVAACLTVSHHKSRGFGPYLFPAPRKAAGQVPFWN